MKRPLAILGSIALGASNAGAHTANADGSAAEWSGIPPSQVHDTAVSNGEWIYRGEVGDNRGDPNDIAEPNMDLTEVRMTIDPAGGGTLYLLVRFRDVIVTDEVSVSVGFHTSSSSINFMGDESGVVFNVVGNRPNSQLSIHNTSAGSTEIEEWHDGSSDWVSPAGQDSFISTANNLLEASIPLSAIGLTTSSTPTVTLCTFDNEVGFNDLTDTTQDYPTCDAVDSVGGDVGVSQNAFDRDLNDGSLGRSYVVNLSSLTAAPAELSVFSAE